MANVQLEKGHTRIANEILNEIMKLNLNGTQFRILIVVWRWTYGFQQKSREMSSTFIADKIDAHPNQVKRELKFLLDQRVIISDQTGKKGARVLKFNKNHDDWKGKAEKEPIPEKKAPVKKKPDKKKYEADNTYYKMAVYFHKRVSKVAKDAGVEHLIKNVNLQSWSNEMRLLVEKDEVGKHLAKDVMDWVTDHYFWRTNVLSAKKLRDKFPDLAIKMSSEKQPKEQPKQSDPRDREIAFNQWVSEGNDPDEFTFK